VFGIGETELVIIVIFGFLLFGPDKLPGMGRTIGRMLRQFREAQEGFTEVVQTEVMDPLSQAMSDPLDEKQQQRAQARAAAFDEDADIEDDGSAGDQPKRRETFAERKARLAREKAEREAAAAQEAADANANAPDASDGGDADSAAAAKDADKDADNDAAAQVEEKPDTSAAALYAMKPKRKPKPAGPESAANDGVTTADVSATDDADAAPDDADAPTAADADTEGGDE
jgi:TatA/E family protein of Tat protein translocase